MRRLLVCVMLAALVRAGGASQNTQGPPALFRGKVDLLTIDVSATDSRGRPVEDLKPGDFAVKVDGKPRQVASVELIKVDRSNPAARPVDARPVDALIASNVSAQNARRIVVAVDQTLITPGMLTPLLRTAGQFVNRLMPADYAAFIGFPEPGPHVDFTTDKTRVHKAMQTISIGQPAKTSARDLEISLFEAFTITGAESVRNKASDTEPGPVMAAVMARAQETGACGDIFNIRQCVYNHASVVAADARLGGTISLRALEALLKDLAFLEGPKTMVVFSAGLVNEDPTRLDDVAKLAAAARTTIHVIAVDRDRSQPVSQGNPPSLSAADRSFELEGLEGIADRTNGIVFRGIASGAGIFEELETQLSAWYLVAVERQPGDPETQRIEVEVKRRGVAVRSNKNAVATTLAARTRPMEELLSDVLSSPFTIPGLPLRISTFTQRDAALGKYRLRVAADVGLPGEPAAQFAVGYVLTRPDGRIVTSAGSRRTLTPGATGPNQLLRYDTAFSVEPGTYALRVAAVGTDGRRGAVVHPIDLSNPTPGEIATSDLIVGNLPAEGETLAPRVEPQVTASELAGYLEVYLPDAAADSVTVTLDIAEGEASPALATQTLTLRPGETASSRVATGFVPVTMTPGRYVARATVRRDGNTVRTLTRPITVVRDPAVVSRAPSRPRGVPISPELQKSTAAYIAEMVNGLANVVAEEAFTLSGPDRRLTSDLLLVRYPGRVRDLIPYRDISHVNGQPLAGREQRLVDLFVKPTEALREQARQIMASADAYVPSAFNPMFVLGFLQSDFQARFDFTVNDAGSDWPREVKAVTFVEIGRPTLLRTGAFGDFDVPTRGIAWIEEATGRVLQTELEVGRGRSAPKMITRFRLDQRLQVTVPIEMRTQNPDGMAVYTNFRRFGVETDTTVPVPSALDQALPQR